MKRAIDSLSVARNVLWSSVFVGIVLVFGIVANILFIHDDWRYAAQRGNGDLTKDGRTNWETYKSEKLGFEIEYPKDVLSEAKDEAGNGFILKSFAITNDKALNTSSPNVQVWEDNIKDSPFNDAKKEIDAMRDYVQFTSLEETEIIGKPVYVVTYKLYGDNGPGTYKGNGVYRTYYFPSFNLSFGYADKNIDRNFSTIEQKMLSTIKITKTEDTVNSGVHKDEQYGFEFQYPKDILLVAKDEDKTQGIILDSYANAKVGEADSPRVQIIVKGITDSAYNDAKNEVDYAPAYAEVPEITGPETKQMGEKEVYITTSNRYDEGDNYGFSRSYYFPNFVLAFSYASHEADGGFGDLEQKIVSAIKFGEN